MFSAFRSPANFTFAGSDAKVAKLLGELPPAQGQSGGTGLLGSYGGPRDGHGKPYRDLVYGTGLALADAMRIVKEAVDQGAYVPENGAVYPNDSFGATLSDAAMLLKRTQMRVIGCNIGGWDTHTSQGQTGGTHGRLLGSVAQGIQALYRDLQAQWQDLLIVTATEFGRTSRENGSKGTDHGLACVMLVAGGSVRGGVYNCGASTWAAGDLFSARERYIAYRTDYRAVFAEIFLRHFGSAPVLLDQVIPGYSAAAAAKPEVFTPLVFLPE